MNRTAIAMAVLLVAGTLAAFPVAGMALTADETNSATNNSSVAPGERLAGVVGVQEAELEGSIQVRAFDIAFDRADDNASKAEVIAREASNASLRLSALAERKAELEQARENGSMSEGEYKARMATVSAEMETVERIANESEERAGGLPADVLEANGVNVTAIQTLRAQASALNGPEVAAIARTIAGGDRGEQPKQARRGDKQSGNASDAIARAERQIQSARERVEQAEQRVNESNASDNATDALQRAQEQLTAAEEALADARNASEAGDDERARERAQAASEYAAQAQQSANDAIEAAEQRDGQDNGSNQTTTSDGSGDGGGQTDTSDRDDSNY